MAFEIEKFTRIISDSKYQFSVGTVAAILTVFPPDRTTLLCVTAIAAVTIFAEGMRDVARWIPAKRPVDPYEPEVNVNVEPTAAGSTTTIKQTPLRGTTNAPVNRPRY
jgi:hypothetical protein